MAEHYERDFDPFTQNVWFKIPGAGRVAISMLDITAYAGYGVRICINYASQIGASFMLLVVLVLLTKPEKRKTPVFILNALALIINTVRSILQCVYFTGPFWNAYAFFAGDYSRVPASQFGGEVAVTVLVVILLVCLEASLVLQVRAVCVTMSQVQRALVLVLSILVALVAIGWRFALAVLNSIYILELKSFIEYGWLANASNWATTGSFCFFSLIFVTKLGFAIRQRHKLGLRQFGPMQVIFIMGCQTLFVPTIFGIVQNFTTVPELVSQTLTIVTIFLPLSSMWASQSITNAPKVGKTTSSQLLKSFSWGSLLFRKSGSSKAMTCDTSTLDTASSTIDSTTFKHKEIFDPFEENNRKTRFSPDIGIPKGLDEGDWKLIAYP